MAHSIEDTVSDDYRTRPEGSNPERGLTRRVVNFVGRQIGSGMRYVGRKAIKPALKATAKYPGLTILGAGTGFAAQYFGSNNFFADPYVLATLGTALRLSPWAFRNFKNRFYKVYGNQIGVEFHGFKLFRDDVAEQEYSQRAIGNIDIVKFYQENKDLFARRAKIVGPNNAAWYDPTSWAHFKTGTHRIVIDTNPRDVNPKPQKVTSFVGEIPFDYYVNWALSYQDDPIYMPLRYLGKLIEFRDDIKKQKLSSKEIADFHISFREGIERNLVESIGGVINHHYANASSVRAAIQSEIDVQRIRPELERIKKNFGVSKIKFNIVGYDFPDKQQEMIIDRLGMTQGEEISRENFLNLVTAIDRLRESGVQIDPNEALKQYMEYTQYTRANGLRSKRAYNAPDDIGPDMNNAVGA